MKLAFSSFTNKIACKGSNIEILIDALPNIFYLFPSPYVTCPLSHVVVFKIG